MIIDSDLCVIIRRLGESLLRERADFVRLCAGLSVGYLGIFWGYRSIFTSIFWLLFVNWLCLDFALNNVLHCRDLSETL